MKVVKRELRRMISMAIRRSAACDRISDKWKKMPIIGLSMFGERQMSSKSHAVSRNKLRPIVESDC